ncbi:MAG: helix-turn-helix domain-containing protein, partial [Deltaproteobacteria bacterium]
MIARLTRQTKEATQDVRGFDDFDLRLGDLMRGERATMGKSLLDVQRELKIKANYIAAIENADPTAFETQGFIAGYVRSYARYLGMEPEWAYEKFCQEGSFETSHGMSPAASTQRKELPVRTGKVDALANPTLGHRLGAQAHEHVRKQFITPVMLVDYLALYERAVT